MSTMPSCLTGQGRGPDPDGPVQLRNLNKMGPWTGRERLRFFWYRLRLAVSEMNYATRRLVELQGDCRERIEVGRTGSGHRHAP